MTFSGLPQEFWNLVLDTEIGFLDVSDYRKLVELESGVLPYSGLGNLHEPRTVSSRVEVTRPVGLDSSKVL